MGNTTSNGTDDAAGAQAGGTETPALTRLQTAFEGAFLAAAGAAAAAHKDDLLRLAREVFPAAARRMAWLLFSQAHGNAGLLWRGELDLLKMQAWELGGLGQEIVDSLLDQSFSILGQTIAGVMGGRGGAAGIADFSTTGPNERRERNATTV